MKRASNYCDFWRLDGDGGGDSNDSAIHDASSAVFCDVGGGDDDGGGDDGDDGFGDRKERLELAAYAAAPLSLNTPPP